MPKILLYPRNSFEKSLEIAEAALALGGSCDEETCAEKLGKKVSGGFKSIISSAQKYGLIEYHRGIIKVSADYQFIVHSYTEDEKKSRKAKAFLTPQVFSELFHRFEGKKLPVELLEKMLIREYNVEPNLASRVSKYFTEGLRSLDLLDSSNIIQSLSDKIVSGEEEKDSVSTAPEEGLNRERVIGTHDSVSTSDIKIENSSIYTIHMYGPGLNTKIEVNEDDDIIIVEATLKKIKNKLKEMEGNPNNSEESS